MRLIWSHWSFELPQSLCAGLLLGCSAWGREGCKKKQTNRTDFVEQWSSNWGMDISAPWQVLGHVFSSLRLPGRNSCMCGPTHHLVPLHCPGAKHPAPHPAALPLGDWNYCPLSAGGRGHRFILPSLASLSPSCMLLAPVWEVLGRADRSEHRYCGGHVEKLWQSCILQAFLCNLWKFLWPLNVVLCTLPRCLFMCLP